MDKEAGTIWIGGGEAYAPRTNGDSDEPHSPRANGDDAQGAELPSVAESAGPAASSPADDPAEQAATPAADGAGEPTSPERAASSTVVLGGESPDLDTPAALLAAGRKLFARYGYAGASVRAITSEAAANLGAITYHFGSKKTLYNRVVEACVAPLATRVEAALSQPVPLLDRLELVVRAYFEHFGENPELPHLMLQELVAGGGPPEAAGPTMRRVFELLLAALREGQAAGVVRAGDPVLLVMSLISQPIFPMLAREPVRQLAGIDLREAATRERVAAHVAKTVRAALEKRPEDGQ